MPFLRLTREARTCAAQLVPDFGQDRARRILADAFQIALARGADAIYVADIEAASAPEPQRKDEPL